MRMEFTAKDISLLLDAINGALDSGTCDAAHETLVVIERVLHGTLAPQSPAFEALTHGAAPCLRREEPFTGKQASEVLIDLPTKIHAQLSLPCLNCGELRSFSLPSAMTLKEANGVYNVFCKNGVCEDQYAFDH